jgi:hypothetical protein
MPEEAAGPESQLRHDADEFLSRLPIMEQMLSTVSPRDVAAGFCFGDVEIQMMGTDALDFVAYAFEFSTKGLHQALTQGGLDTESIERVQRFIHDHAALKSVILRTQRLSNGFKNEFTQLNSRHLVYSRAGKMALALDIISHEHVLINSVQKVEDVFTFALLLLDTVGDALECANEFSSSLSSEALGDEHIVELFQMAHRVATARVAATPPPQQSQDMKALLEAVRDGIERVNSRLKQNTAPVTR